MTEAFRSFGVGSLLTVGGASLVVAALALRDARRSAMLAERRMERIREEQVRLLASFEEERRGLKGELERERELRLESQRRAERVHRELLLSRQARERLKEELKWEREAREKGLRALRDAERRARRSENELQELREAERDREVATLAVPVKASSEWRSEGLRRGGHQEAPEEASLRRAPGNPEGVGLGPVSGATGVPPASLSSRREKAHRGVLVPHPDDDTEREKTRGGRHGRGSAPVEMFRKHYDKYLENYGGYLDLAEGLYRMRDGGEVPDGSFAEHEWEERLRRVRDGIRRTTARLDILEEHNPQLATDARVSRRASLSRRHEELEEMHRRGR